MKKFVLFLLLIIFVQISFSQENVTPIKYGMSKQMIIEDSIFNKFIIESEINFDDFSVVDISTFTDYCTILRTKKNSHKVFSIKYVYNNLNKFSVEKSFVHMNYDEPKQNITKQLFCYRDLTPDKNNFFTVRIFYVF